MTRTHRMLSSVLLVLTALVAAGLTAPPTAAAAIGPPALTAVGSGAGPVAPTRIVLTGRNLKGADAVRFGTRAGTAVRSLSTTRVEVRTPRGASAGTVSVRVHTKAGWSKAVRAARYTFVPAPVLARLSRTSGSYAGGQLVTLTGRNLGRTTRVRFGAVDATLVRRAATKVVVRTPIGVLGKAKVRVVTPGGASGARTFTYTHPARLQTSTIVPASGTFTPATVDWVTGGSDTDTGASAPWLVGLPAGAAAPEVGDRFLLPPGTAVFPSGLAGTVDGVAVQDDGSRRVTVVASDLEDALDTLSARYAGPLQLDQPGSPARVAAENAIEWPINGSGLFCHDQDGNTVAFGAELTLKVSDVDVSQDLDLGGLFSRPTYDGAFTAEVTTRGTFHGEVASTCEVKPAWQNANRRVIPLGTTGLTVSFAPDIEFSVSAKGTVRILDRTRTTYAVNVELGKAPRFSKTSHTIESDFGGSLTFEASLVAGVSVQFGLLDRAGLEGKVLLGLAADLEASLDDVCITGKVILKLSVNVFLDAWVARWESPSLTAQIDLYEFLHKCVAAETDAPSTNEPEISTTRLKDAPLGSSYADTLRTADDRSGTWSIVRYALPAGLTLDPATGAISGTPTDAVGDYPVIVDFVDTAGQATTSTVRIRVAPADGLGGGDLQITLQWTGPADLDLHVIDPAAEEIYYRNPASASGGLLDHDANAGCNGTADDDNAVENVFWPPHSAPTGSYAARVVVYAVCAGPLDWHLTIRRDGVLIVDQTGTGDSSDFTFDVTAAAGRHGATRTAQGSAGGRPAWRSDYPAK